MKKLTANATFTIKGRQLFANQNAVDAVLTVLKMRDDKRESVEIDGNVVRTQPREVRPLVIKGASKQCKAG